MRCRRTVCRRLCGAGMHGPPLLAQVLLERCHGCEKLHSASQQVALNLLAQPAQQLQQGRQEAAVMSTTHKGQASVVHGLWRRPQAQAADHMVSTVSAVTDVQARLEASHLSRRRERAFHGAHGHRSDVDGGEGAGEPCAEGSGRQRCCARRARRQRCSAASNRGSCSSHRCQAPGGAWRVLPEPRPARWEG